MIRYFTHHPTAANLLMIIFIVMGVFSITSLKRETFPEFSADMIQIRVIYPGASAEEVEEAICQRVEDAIEDVNYIKEVVSEAREGVGTITVEMQSGGNLQVFRSDIESEVDSIDDFPDIVEDPIISELNERDRVVAIAVTGPMSVPDLKAFAEQLRERMQQRDGVSLVEIAGFSEHQIRIEIPTSAAMQYGLSLSQIADVIAAQSVDLPAGAIETHEQEITVRFADERTTPLEFEDLIVLGGASGGEVRLGDIATITDLFELEEEAIYFNGRRAALLEVTKTKAEDTLTAFAAVEQFVQDEREMLPPGVELTLTQDISSIVQDRLSLLTRNGIQGLILVFLALWLFFSFRFSFWVAMGLPISFLGAFFFFPILGISINMISMVGLLLGLGLLMDDAIVLSENVASHLHRGESVYNAVINGVMEVRGGVFSSFLTTVFLFGSISFLEGNIGKILRAMPQVLILVLAVSLAEAFFILPHHLAHSLKGREGKKPSRVRTWIDSRIDCGRQVVWRIASLAVRWRYLALGLAAMVFLSSAGLMVGGVVKFKVFPDIDGDVIVSRILLPQGTPLERTQEIVERIVGALDHVNAAFKPQQPNQEDLIINVLVQTNVNSDASEQGPHVATVVVDLLKAEDRNAVLDDVLNMWREEVGDVTDVISLKFAQMDIGPAGRAIDIALEGEDLNELSLASFDLREYLSHFAGVNDISDDMRPGKPELNIRLREGATSQGLTSRAIASQLRAALYGQTASEIQVGSESYEIDVRLADSDRDSWADLEYFYITLPNGEQTPLGAVASITETRSWARIGRIDGRRTVRVQADVDSAHANTNEVIRTTMQEFAPQLSERYPGIKIVIKGEAEEGAETGKSMLRALLTGLIGIFVILSYQFRSYIEPFIVMTTIPMCLIGAILGHLVMGLDFTMPSAMGFISLSGVVVNDSLILVLFIKARRTEGMSAAEAAPQAARERFRAVMLTSLTTVAGLTPLLFERSLQAQVLIPLAASLVFGLMASTVLVLLLLPALYVILDDLGLSTKVGTQAIEHS